ncbi:hypothetical protein RJ639_006935 [Escallonia herrerae]|uniref:Pentatricopeptide repeat-containing protein n=1 Tax=Escallonia herrerae TaxID=1293975 RepID=A0AA88VUK4_9ASTE|nr:hypothetical protein RJ639_006935 [Escallonia herrerae]
MHAPWKHGSGACPSPIAAPTCTNSSLMATQAFFTTHGLHRNTFATNKLLAFCALSDTGSLSYASLIFIQIHEPNTFTYNTLIRAYSLSPHPHSALDYFHLMLNSHTLRPDQHTFPFVLIACANASWACSGKQVHNWVFKNGLAASDGHVQTALIRHNN